MSNDSESDRWKLRFSKSSKARYSDVIDRHFRGNQVDDDTTLFTMLAWSKKAFTMKNEPWGRNLTFHRVRKGLNCPIRLEHKFEMLFQLLAGIKNKNIMIDDRTILYNKICIHASHVDNLI